MYLMVEVSFSPCLSMRPADTISLFMICHLSWFYKTVLICDKEANPEVIAKRRRDHLT